MENVELLLFSLSYKQKNQIKSREKFRVQGSGSRDQGAGNRGKGKKQGSGVRGQGSGEMGKGGGLKAGIRKQERGKEDRGLRMVNSK